MLLAHRILQELLEAKRPATHPLGLDLLPVCFQGMMMTKRRNEYAGPIIELPESRTHPDLS